jgi:hypothetical protein
VKLSAPPPPPTEAEQPTTPGESEKPGADTPPPSDAGSAPPVHKSVSWPGWFTGADCVLALLAILLAFLAASFVARNSDLWLNLAAGKRLLAGEYRPGTDPFSYTAADRTWVNHSLLFDAGAYLLYDMSGTVLVVVKALAVALAFALLIGLRRPGFALWPWAVLAIVAVIATAPYLLLRPLVGSLFMLAITLYLLFRTTHRPNSWRFPIAIGFTFWIWAMIDQWFFIGPLVLALVLLGEFLQYKLLKKTTEGTSDPEPLGPLPDMPTLAKALAIGILACMLNPHHFRVWELPYEMMGASGTISDVRLRHLAVTPLDRTYYTNSAFGYNQNGLAYAILFVAGGAALGLGVGRIHISHVTLWIGLGVLSLVTVYAIPFLAFIAVPIIAAQLNLLSSRITLATWGDPKTRFVLFGSAGGRVVCLISAVILCVLAWPGWIHPSVNNPAFARRVAWAVEPDAATVMATEQLQNWRSSGKLPPDARGFFTSLEFANYCAWFAPLEKVFMNARYNHHRAEIPAYVDVRRELGLLPQDEPPESENLESEFRKHKIEYLAIHATQTDRGFLWDLATAATMRMWFDETHYSPWYLDGRTAICGWRARPGAEGPTFGVLKIDAVSHAFGPGVARLVSGEVRPVPPALGWEGEFISGTSVPHPGADEAISWVQYSRVLQERQRLRQQGIGLTLFIADLAFGGNSLLRGLVPAVQLDDELASIPFIALRAARRAITANPDHPDGYAALAEVLANPGLPLSPDERVVGQVTALRQCLVRMPTPERFRQGVYLASPTLVAKQLVELYLGERLNSGQFRGMPVNLPAFQILNAIGATGSAVVIGGKITNRVGGPYLLPLDVARDTLRIAQQYAEQEFAGLGEQGKQIRESISGFLKVLDEECGRMNNLYERAKSPPLGQPAKLSDQWRIALQLNLTGEALRILTDLGTDFQKEFGNDSMAIDLSRAALLLAVGRLEDASTTLGIAPNRFDEVPSLRQSARWLTYQKYVFEGDYAGAGAILEDFVAGGIGMDPDPTPEQAKLKLEGLLKADKVLPVLPELLMFGSSPLDLVPKQELLAELLNPFYMRQQQLTTRRVGDSEFFWRRGYLFLVEGEIAEARKRFESSRRPGVPEWGIPERIQPEAKRYLRLIDQAQKK